MSLYKKVVHVCYITLGIETVSCPFFCYGWQGCMWIEKERKRILFNALPAKFNKNIMVSVP